MEIIKKPQSFVFIAFYLLIVKLLKIFYKIVDQQYMLKTIFGCDVNLKKITFYIS